MLFRKFIPIFALAVSFAPAGHPAHASPEFEKFKEFLQEVSREAGLYEGDFAAMAQYIPSLPSYPDSSSRPRETLNAGLSEQVEAESAFGKLMYHLARNEASLALAASENTKTTAVNASISPIGHVITRIRRRELIWGSTRIYADRMIYEIENNPQGFEKNRGAALGSLALLKMQLDQGLETTINLELNQLIYRSIRIAKKLENKGIIRIPGYPDLNANKLQLFLKMARLEEQEDPSRFNVEDLGKILKNEGLRKGFSSEDAFGHPSFDIYWRESNSLFRLSSEAEKLTEEFKRTYDNLNIAVPDRYNFVVPIYIYAEKVSEKIQRLLEGATFDPREDPQFDIDRISLQAIPSNAAISAQKSKLIQVICSSFAQFLECVNSKKFLHALDHLHKPTSELESKEPTEPDVGTDIKQIPTRPYSRSDESADRLSLSRVSPKSPESTTPRARTLSAPAGPISGKIHLTGSAAALYYATGVSDRLVKGYKTPSFSNSDFYELLKQLGTRSSVKETGNGSSKYYEVPSRDLSHGKILPDKTRAFRIHLSHNGSDDLPLHTIRRYLGAHLSLAGLDDAAIDFELPR